MTCAHDGADARVQRIYGGVSALTNYRLDNFSSEKLIEFFNSLGYDMDVLIRPEMFKRRGAMQVLMAV